MKLFNDKRYEKALVIGAGSGRDMASAVLVTERLRECKIDVHLAGFLTPWALHTFDGELERPINDLSDNKTKKFIASGKEVLLDSYFEPELLRLNDELGLEIGKFYLLSLQYGTEALRKQLDCLIQENGYSVVIAVDVGGDILARKTDYPRLLTPIVDLSCLSLLANLKAQVECYLVVVAPGVDGEIPWQDLADILDELHGKGLVLGSETLNKDSGHYQTFERINRHLSSWTSSQSNTFRLIDKVVSSTNTHISDTLVRNVALNGKHWKLSFSIELSTPLARGIYQCSLKCVHSLRGMDINYENIYQAFVTLKQLGAGGTEVDLSFVPASIRDGAYEETIFLLTPPERVEGALRKEILEYGLKLTGEGKISCSVILEKDIHALGLPANLDVCEKESGFYALRQRGSGKEAVDPS